MGTHAPACINYMKLLTDPTVFYFCAVPQLMAIATLNELYNNPRVFNREVKIRKGLALKLMKEGAIDMSTVVTTFRTFCDSIHSKAKAAHDETTCSRVTEFVEYLDNIQE